MTVQIAESVLGSSRKVADLPCQALRKEEQPFEGNIFAERNEMDFIIAGNDLPLWVQHRRAVGGSFPNRIDVTNEKVRTQLLRDRLHPAPEIRVFAEIK